MSLHPYFGFVDAAGAVAALREGLGFERVGGLDDEDGTVVHAELRRGDAVIMLGADPQGGGANVGSGTYLVVEDVDAQHAKALGAGFDEVWAPQDTEWGTRRSRLRDPEGFEWSLGTYVPGSG